VEILAMVLGFIVYWPIGLGKKSGYPGDIISFGREKWGNWTNWARDSGRWSFAVNNWGASGFGMGSTGNRAFDEWRTTELARLEEERQKLVAEPGIARSLSGSWMRIETGKPRPGTRANVLQ
jgi:Protein of unknown function (DUF2852)